MRSEVRSLMMLQMMLLLMNEFVPRRDCASLSSPFWRIASRFSFVLFSRSSASSFPYECKRNTVLFTAELSSFPTGWLKAGSVLLKRYFEMDQTHPRCCFQLCPMMSWFAHGPRSLAYVEIKCAIFRRSMAHFVGVSLARMLSHDSSAFTSDAFSGFGAGRPLEGVREALCNCDDFAGAVTGGAGWESCSLNSTWSDGWLSISGTKGFAGFCGETASDISFSMPL